MKIDFRNNNLDWLRLIFAAQVMLIHGFEDLRGVALSGVAEGLHHFPGVPAFFFVSGFLIYASFDRKPELYGFVLNRVYRIWPGLLFVTCGGLCLVIYSHALSGSLSENVVTYLVWFASQISLGQAWNPMAFRDIGLGVINGALWTITVEILFYISVPIIFFLEKKFRHTVLVLFVLSFLCFSVLSPAFKEVAVGGKTLFDYLSLTPIIWGWMFLFGTLVYKNIELIEKNFHYVFLALPVLLILIIADIKGSFLFNASGNNIGLIYFVVFALTIVILAFRTTTIPLGFDISFGVYVWHMVVINAFLVLGWTSIVAMVAATVLFALLSWFWIEQPVLKRKNSSLRAAG